MEYGLAKDLKSWRAERPDEWTMDRFIRVAEQLQKERDEAIALFLDMKGYVDNIIKSKDSLYKLSESATLFLESINNK